MPFPSLVQRKSSRPGPLNLNFEPSGKYAVPAMWICPSLSNSHVTSPQASTPLVLAIIPAATSRASRLASASGFSPLSERIVWSVLTAIQDSMASLPDPSGLSVMTCLVSKHPAHASAGARNNTALIQERIARPPSGVWSARAVRRSAGKTIPTGDLTFRCCRIDVLSPTGNSPDNHTAKGENGNRNI